MSSSTTWHCDTAVGLPVQVPDFGAESNSDGEDASKGPSMIVQFTSMEGEGKGPQVNRLMF